MVGKMPARFDDSDDFARRCSISSGGIRSSEEAGRSFATGRRQLGSVSWSDSSVLRVVLLTSWLSVRRQNRVELAPQTRDLTTGDRSLSNGYRPGGNARKLFVEAA